MGWTCNSGEGKKEIKSYHLD